MTNNDEIVIFSSTVEQHLERLEVMLGRLQQENFKIELTDSIFQWEMHYLGHVISDEGVSTNPSKVDVVAKWHPLQQTDPTIQEVMVFWSGKQHPNQEEQKWISWAALELLG